MIAGGCLLSLIAANSKQKPHDLLVKSSLNYMDLTDTCIWPVTSRSVFLHMAHCLHCGALLLNAIMGFLTVLTKHGMARKNKICKHAEYYI